MPLISKYEIIRYAITVILDLEFPFDMRFLNSGVGAIIVVAMAVPLARVIIEPALSEGACSSIPEPDIIGCYFWGVA